MTTQAATRLPISDDAGLETAERFVAALHRADLATLAELLAPEAVWHIQGTGPVSGTFRRRGRILRHLLDIWQLTRRALREDLVEVTPGGDGPVARRRLTRPDGRTIEEWLTFRIRHGLVRELWSFAPDPAAYDALWRYAREA